MKLRHCVDATGIASLDALGRALDVAMTIPCATRHLVLLSDAFVQVHGPDLAELGLGDGLAILEVGCRLPAALPAPSPELPLILRPAFANVGDMLGLLGETLGRRPEFEGLDLPDILECLRADCAERPHDSGWVVAYADGRACGFALPSLTLPATVMGLAVAPQARGRGFGKALHRYCLAFLGQRGGTNYRDHIDADSGAMRAICASHGCTVERRLFQYRLNRNEKGGYLHR